MVTISKDGAAVRNTGTVTGAPAYRIVGDGVHLTNADSGRIIASSNAVPAIVIEGAGAVIVNELGGIIRAPDFQDVAIVGTAFADTVVNEGLLIGQVRLGDGADSYTHRAQDTASVIALGPGNDLYRHESDHYFAQAADGGPGTDRIVIGATSLIDGRLLSGFERLDIAAGVSSIVNFSGYLTVKLPSDGAFHSFTDSVNPLADLAFAGGWLSVNTGSVFDDVAGSDVADNLELRGTILGDVALGGGDDAFGIFWTNGAEGPVFGGTADGGAGVDALQLMLEGDQTFDLTDFSNFEDVSVNAATAATKTVRLVGANGYSRIIAEFAETLVLADSYSPEATFYPSFPSTLQLESTATVNHIGSYFPGNEQEPQANDLFSFAVINGGTVLGNVWFYFGDDSYDGSGGSVGGTIYGMAGNDRLTGGGGVDRIEGGYGADTIAGGGGADTLRGGGGADRFVYAARSDSVFGAADTINGFETGIDKIDLQAVRARSVSWTTSGSTHLVTVETTTGQMQLNISGAIAAADFLLTRGMILGTAADDRIEGTGGNDVIDGGLGADTMSGGLGNDYYFVERGGDLPVELAGQGVDSVEASVSYALPANIEKLFLTGAAKEGTGNSLANTIGGTAGANVLRGGADNDVMNGWAGNDTYHVDSSADKALEARADGGTDTVVSSADFVLGNHVENLVLAGSVAVDGTGNALANTLLGNNAANILKGAAGDDTIRGGGGGDRLYGGAGNDLLKGGTGADGFYFSSPLNKTTNVDTIEDFQRVYDTIYLDTDIFTAIATGTLTPGAFRLGTAAADAGDRIVYDQASGRLFYDADGVGGSAAIMFAQLTPGTAVTHADFVGYI